jgi:hypothetical protein
VRPKENDLPVRVRKIRGPTYELFGNLKREIEIDEALFEYSHAVENRRKPVTLTSNAKHNTSIPLHLYGTST